MTDKFYVPIRLKKETEKNGWASGEQILGGKTGVVDNKTGEKKKFDDRVLVGKLGRGNA